MVSLKGFALRQISEAGFVQHSFSCGEREKGKINHTNHGDGSGERMLHWHRENPISSSSLS